MLEEAVLEDEGGRASLVACDDGQERGRSEAHQAV